MVIIAGLVDRVACIAKLLVDVVAWYDNDLKGRVLSLHFLVAVKVEWDAVIAPVETEEVTLGVCSDVCQ